MFINLTVENQGTYTEIFNVTAYANTTIIDTLVNITLTGGNSTIGTFTWNTSGFAKGNYTISAVADTVIGETDMLDNNRTDGWVIVAMIGDITGPEGVPDGECDIRDIALVAKAYGADLVTDPAQQQACQTENAT